MGLYITGTFQTFFKCKLVKMYVRYGEMDRERERMKDIAPRQRTSVWGLQSGGT